MGKFSGYFKMFGLHLSMQKYSARGDNYRKDRDCRKDCKWVGRVRAARFLRKPTLRKKFGYIKQYGL